MANVKKQEHISLKDRWGHVKDYLRGIYNELKKVHWPGRNQIIAYTGVVLIAVVIVALLIWVFDSILSHLLELLFNALK